MIRPTLRTGSRTGNEDSRTVRDVGLTGVIIAVVAVAWLAFGVPQFLSVPRPVDEEVEDPSDRIGGAVRILRTTDDGTAEITTGRHVHTVPLVGADGRQFGEAELSTRLTRRTELSRLRQIEAAAVRIRRRALAGVFVVDALVLAGALAGWWSWWWATGAGALLVAAFVALRVSVVLVDRELDRRLTALRTGNEERTLAISRADLLESSGEVEETGPEAGRTSRDVVSFHRPVLFEDVPSRELAPSLWEPLPVPAPTYVQRPIAARSVRTIDLSSPDLNAAMDRAQGELPVVADGRDRDAVPVDRESRRPRLRAAGE